MSMHSALFATFSGVHVKLPLAAAPHSTPAAQQEVKHAPPGVAPNLASASLNRDVRHNPGMQAAQQLEELKAVLWPQGLQHNLQPHTEHQSAPEQLG